MVKYEELTEILSIFSDLSSINIGNSAIPLRKTAPLQFKKRL